MSVSYHYLYCLDIYSDFGIQLTNVLGVMVVKRIYVQGTLYFYVFEIVRLR